MKIWQTHYVVKSCNHFISPRISLYVYTIITIARLLATLANIRLGYCNKFYFTFKFEVQM
jgi:hypothetical protein